MSRDISYHLEPGYIYVSLGKEVIRTVVGSCVAICLWDSRLRMGGMNHFLYPETRNPVMATAQYGNVAIAQLLRMMNEAGCRSKNMEAQIFGGAQIRKTKMKPVGESNVVMARQSLSRQKIRIVSEDVGGNMGRKILFDAESGEVAVLKVRQLRSTDWIYG